MFNLKRLLLVVALGANSFGCGDGGGSVALSEGFGGSGNYGSSAPSTDAVAPRITGSGAGGGAGSGGSSAGVALGAAAGSGGTNVAPVPPSNAGDRYGNVGTNPFVMVAHDPLSTFATDVDTASYDIFRRDVNRATLPDHDSVRLEEYVNSFRYAYPKAAFDAPVPFSVLLSAAHNPMQAETTLLRVGIQGKAAPPDEQKPANLVFLVDVSGSMQAPDRLPLAQLVLRQTLDLLQPNDRVSIVSYASDTRVRLASTAVSERETIVGGIDGLSAGGSTAGASGLELAYQQAQAGFIQGGINHVVLCTDGDFNVGPSSNQALLDLIRQERKLGVTMTALGFGAGNLNDSMLEAVSNAGNGFYAVISSEQQASDYVHRRMLSTLSLIAKDVKVQVEFNPQLVSAYRLLGYEDRDIADNDFRNDIVDAGEIGSDHQVTALYELVLAGGQLPQSSSAPTPLDGAAYAGTPEVAAGDLVLVKLRFKEPDAGETDPASEVKAALAPSAIAAEGAPLDDDFAWAASMAAFAEVLKVSPYARLDRLDELQATFQAQTARDSDRAEFVELFAKARALLPAR